MNSHLRAVIDQALKANMPMSTIQNNIKKFDTSAAQLKKYFIGIKSLNKVFMICEVYTENLPGLKQSMGSALRRAGKTLYADVQHLFDEIGYVQVTKSAGTFASASEFEDKLTEDAIECDAQEVEDIDFATKSATFICRPIDIAKVKKILNSLDYKIIAAEHIFVPKQIQKLTEAEIAVVNKLRERLSQIDGIENLYDNVELLAEQSA